MEQKKTEQMEEVKDIFQVESFVLQCNDMLGGKFLDLNKRLDKFLAEMTASEDILQLLADALEGFDHEKEFASAFFVDKKTGEAKVTLPSDDKKRLALTVTVLNNLASGKLNSTKFLQTFFQDKKTPALKNFLEKIIRPYRDLICKYFEIDPIISAGEVQRRAMQQQKVQKQEEVLPEKEQFPGLDNLMQCLEKTCNQILALLKFEKKRTDVLDDVEFVTNSILAACEKKNLMVVNGLVIGLNYVSKKFKSVRHLVEDLNELIYDYYDFLAGQQAEQEQNIQFDEEDFERE